MAPTRHPRSAELKAMTKGRGGRVTPKGSRPPYLRPVGDPSFDGSPLDQIIDSGGRELLDEDDPIAAETWASAILDVFDRARLEARLEGMLIAECSGRYERGPSARHPVTTCAIIVPWARDESRGPERACRPAARFAARGYRDAGRL